MKKIPLTQGKYALVDDKDFDSLSKYKWSLGSRGRYARRYFNDNGKYSQISMHRFLIGASRGTQVDHLDRNKLNNQRYNLRLATPQNNMANRYVMRSNTTGYKGVMRSTSKTNPWYVQIKCNYKRIHVGMFKTAKEAALAYNKKAKELFGEFALLNKI